MKGSKDDDNRPKAVGGEGFSTEGKQQRGKRKASKKAVK